MLQVYRMFRVKYLPWTTTKPMRFRITDLLHGDSKIYSYNTEKYNQYKDNAIAILEERGISVDAIVKTFKGGEYTLLSNNFETTLIERV